MQVIRGLYGIKKSEDWAIITAPRRRHKEGLHFSTAICEEVAKRVGMVFYKDAISCSNRDRLHPDLKLEKEVKEKNIVLFDDILTTGTTLRSCMDMFPTKNVISIVGINNN